MKKIAAFLLAVMMILWSTAVVFASTGSISGRIYVPNSERGLRPHSDNDGHGFLGWDLSAEKNRSVNQSDVWLIAQDIDFASMTDEEINAWYREGKIPTNQPIYYTQTDKTGKYNFADIPVGHYFLIILDASGHSNHSDITDKKALQQKMRYWDDFELFMIGMKGFSVDRIIVETGKNTNVRQSALI